MSPQISRLYDSFYYAVYFDDVVFHRLKSHWLMLRLCCVTSHDKASFIFELASSPRPLLVRRGEGELFCGTFSRRSPESFRGNTGLISVTPSAYLNLRSPLSRGSRFNVRHVRHRRHHQNRRRQIHAMMSA